MSIADQTEAELGGAWSILVRQRRDHQRLDVLLDRVRATAGAEQDAWLRRTARLVFPHAFAEESVLWPDLRRRLPEGEELTLQVEQEHQEVNELWVELEAGGQSPGERSATIDRLVQVLQEDVRDEEDQLLPRLQARSDLRGLRRLGVLWELVRRTAPTRPHPVVARRPPGNALAALPLTVLDRSRDVLDVVGRRAGAGASGWARTADRALARVAGVVERQPLLRRGERASTHRRA